MAFVTIGIANKLRMYYFSFMHGNVVTFTYVIFVAIECIFVVNI